MFVVFRQDAFLKIDGFDERRFFMYLEDADICRRLLDNGWKTLINPSEQVIHMAQRASRRNLKHMRWHAVSAFRFLSGF
jgi:GT2 family glycosyltransferase